MSDLLKVEEILADLLLCEISDIDAANMLNPEQQQLRDQSRVPLAKRVRDSAQQLRQDIRSTDPLIRKKALLQRQLAQIIAQIKKKQEQQTNNTNSAMNIGSNA
ncbi:MAG: hypothetical protein KDH96_02435 [Candidatus Riesia sp.]|nr:hypothetical protein [Candidatus Riesia sp.]